jgi:hypothetical protein
VSVSPERPSEIFGSALIRKPFTVAALIFTAVAGLLIVFHANHLVFSPDEGIVLDAAEQMLGGKKLYVDLYGNMSPGTFWLQEFVFWCLGLSLRAGRMIVILDFALQCALVFWLIAGAGYRNAAWAATVLFFLFEASNATLLVPGHRWDSAALSLLSVALCLHGASTERPGWWIAGGAIISFAAFCTPSIAELALITVLALIVSGRRRFLLPYVGAATGIALYLLLVMQIHGYLRAFAQQMSWLASNYSRVNVTPYGWPLGGYGALFRTIAATPVLVWPLVSLSIMLPAALPMISVLGWGAVWVRRWRVGATSAADFAVRYMLICLVGYVVSTQPRPDITHLTIVSPLGYVLVGILIGRYLKPAVGLIVFSLALPWGLLLIAQSGATLAKAADVPTPAGLLRVAPEEVPAVRKLLSEVRPGQSLYVHPYLPLFYFLTQTANPTRYPYLAPGMMGPPEERTALQELQSSAPVWVLYLPLRTEDYLKVFPSAKGINVHYEAIESWIRANYAPLSVPVWISGYELMARRAESPKSRLSRQWQSGGMR